MPVGLENGFLFSRAKELLAVRYPRDLRIRMTPLAPPAPGNSASRSRRNDSVDDPWTTVWNAAWRWRMHARIPTDFLKDPEGWLAGGELHEQFPTEVVKRGIHRTTWRLTLGEIPCYLKLSHSRSWTEWLRGLIRGRPAEREFRKLELLAEAGLPVTPPLAVGVPASRFESGSWLLTEEVPGQPLDELAPPERRPGLPWLSREQRVGLTRALARLLAQMHAAGFCHRDLHAGNLLWTPGDGDDPTPRLTLVDVAAIERCAGAMTEFRRWHDLSQLRHAFCLAASRSDQLRFARLYLQESLRIVPGQDRTRYRRTVRELAARAVRYSETAWKKADRKWSRGNRRVVIIRPEDVELRGVASLGRELLERLAGCEGDPAAESPAGWQWIEFSAARSVWELGHALLRRGIRVAEPLVLIPSECDRSGQVAFAEPVENAGCRAGARDAERLLAELQMRGFAAPSAWCDHYGELQNGQLALSPAGLAWLAQATVIEAPPPSKARAA